MSGLNVSNTAVAERISWRSAQEGGSRDVLLLDIALDSWYRTLVERVDKSELERDGFVDMVQLTLDNGAIAGESEELHQVPITEMKLQTFPGIKVHPGLRSCIRCYTQKYNVRPGFKTLPGLMALSGLNLLPWLRSCTRCHTKKLNCDSLWVYGSWG